MRTILSCFNFSLLFNLVLFSCLLVGLGCFSFWKTIKVQLHVFQKVHHWLCEGRTNKKIIYKITTAGLTHWRYSAQQIKSKTGKWKKKSNKMRLMKFNYHGNSDDIYFFLCTLVFLHVLEITFLYELSLEWVWKDVIRTQGKSYIPFVGIMLSPTDWVFQRFRVCTGDRNSAKHGVRHPSASVTISASREISCICVYVIDKVFVDLCSHF